jgi:hypothetical protein
VATRLDSYSTVTRLEKISERDFFNRGNFPKVSTSPPCRTSPLQYRTVLYLTLGNIMFARSFRCPVSLQPLPVFIRGCRLLVSDLVPAIDTLTHGTEKATCCARCLAGSYFPHLLCDSACYRFAYMFVRSFPVAGQTPMVSLIQCGAHILTPVPHHLCRHTHGLPSSMST